MFWCREEIWEDTLTVVSQGLVPHEESISEDMTGNHTTCQAFTQIYFLPPDNDEDCNFQYKIPYQCGWDDKWGCCNINMRKFQKTRNRRKWKMLQLAASFIRSHFNIEHLSTFSTLLIMSRGLTSSLHCTENTAREGGEVNIIRINTNISFLRHSHLLVNMLLLQKSLVWVTKLK